MNFVEFVKKFPTEDACIKHFKQVKEVKGIICKKYGSAHHSWNKFHKSHDCKECGYRTTLKSGTVMESSNLPYRYWLNAIFLMTMTKKGISAKEM